MRLAKAHSAITRPTIVWRNKVISFPTKIKFYKTIVLSIELYGCESWMLTVEKIQANENKCYRMNV